MTTHQTSSWSESRQQQTREAIVQLPVTPDKKDGDAQRFDDVEALLQAGWAVD